MLLALALAMQQPMLAKPMEGWMSTNVALSQTQSPRGATLTASTAPAPNSAPWSNALHRPSDAALTTGDVVSLRFWARSPTRTRAGFAFEQTAAPNAKFFTWVVTPGPDWKEYVFAGASPRDFAAGATRIAVFLGYAPGKVEIAGLELQNLGKVDVNSVKQSVEWFGGVANPDSWRKAAEARIEKYRKNDLTVQVVDPQGRAIPDAEVKIELTRHAFRFGTAAPAARLVGTSAEDRRFQATVKRLFNTVTFENDLKWNQLDGQSYTQVDQALTWMQANGIEARGHCLVWGSRRWLPRGLWELSDDQIRQRIDTRVAETTKRFAGKVYLWDVVNEAVTERELWERIGWPAFANAFKLARQNDPWAQLAYNDYNITEENQAGTRQKLEAKKRIDYLIAQGAPLDVIGIQSHEGVPITPIYRVLEILDEMAAYGKPLEITEFDLGVWDDKVHGDHFRDYVTAAFSHPKVQAFIVWGFWEGSHWRANAGGAMVRRDWSYRPAAAAWEDLVLRKWTTRESGRTGANGSAKFRGFLGNYKVTVKVGGKTVEQPVVLAAKGPMKAMVLVR